MKFASAILALLAATTTAQKTFYAHEEHEVISKKSVKKGEKRLTAYDGALCLFDNGGTDLCVNHNVDVIWGIEFLQSYGSVTADGEYWTLTP
jgi:hypothetical protein